LPSDKTIAEIAEQSVSNFVESINHQLLFMEALPVAATVEPSSEDLEMAAQSWLESELRTHLSRELSRLSSSTLSGDSSRGELQIAEDLPTNNDSANSFQLHTQERCIPVVTATTFIGGSWMRQLLC
jgi:hypothetical protein